MEVCEGVVILDLHQCGHFLRRLLERLQSLGARNAIDCQVWLLCVWAQEILYEGCPAGVIQGSGSSTIALQSARKPGFLRAYRKIACRCRGIQSKSAESRQHQGLVSSASCHIADCSGQQAIELVFCLCLSQCSLLIREVKWHSLAKATLPDHQDFHVPVSPRGLDPRHCGKCCAHILRELRGCVRQQALAPLLIETGNFGCVFHFMSGWVLILLCIYYAVSPASDTASLYLL